MSDPVAAITEAEAQGETAAIFADIRAVYGVSVVNLVWRHLATIPGALPWAWHSVRPLYRAGIIAREAAALRTARRLPALPPVPDEVFAACGLTAADMRQIRLVLDAYDRTNPMALVALSVVEQQLAGTAGPPAVMAPVAPAADAALELPPLLRLDQMAPATAALVLRLNRLGAAGTDPLLASMYRNLAHWPAYLALAWAMLAPLDAAGALAPLIAATRAAAQAQARAIGTAETAPPPLPVDQGAAVARALERFTGDAICRMVVLCGILRQASSGG